jgi:hypothetical protein
MNGNSMAKNSYMTSSIPVASGATTTTTNSSPLSGLLLLITCYLAWPWLCQLIALPAALLLAGGSLAAQLLGGLTGMLLSPAVISIALYLVCGLIFLQGQKNQIESNFFIVLIYICKVWFLPFNIKSNYNLAS